MNSRREEFQHRVSLAEKHRVLKQVDLSMPWQRLEKIPHTHPRIEQHIDEYAYAAEAVDNLIDAYQKGFLRITVIDQDSFELEFLPVQIKDGKLGHLCEVGVFQENIKRSLWGERGAATYLQTTAFGVEGGLEAHESFRSSKEIVRVYIDTARLEQCRDIFLDPECLAVTPEEYPHAFLVYDGIPRETIVSAERVRLNSSERPAIDMSDWPTDEEVEAEVEKQQKRLRDFLKSIE
jgi:hypothetical protein